MVSVRSQRSCILTLIENVDRARFLRSLEITLENALKVLKDAKLC